MTDKRREILDRITEMRNQIGDLQGHLELLRTACEQLKREKAEAIERAEKAERKLAKAVEYKDEAIRERNQAEAEVERLSQELDHLTIKKGEQ